MAAAGGHSLLLVGPPGCGKSMLAQRMPGILPALTAAEALDVATVASVTSATGLLAAPVRPFRAPHHTASASAIIGGLLTLLADDLARTLMAPYELPVGLITSLVGGSFFLYLIRARQRSLRGKS